MDAAADAAGGGGWGEKKEIKQELFSKSFAEGSGAANPELLAWNEEKLSPCMAVRLQQGGCR